MWRSAASAFLLTGLALGGVRAGEARSTPVPDAPPELVSPYQQYDLKLSTFYPAPRRSAGVLLHVRINGGRPLRLVLDSGAEFIVIGTKEARSAGLSAGSEMDLAGLESRAARVGRAETVQIGPLSFRNCRVAFVKGKVVEGADGVIPLSLFSAFRLRLDLPEKMLGLIPYPRDEDLAVLPTPGAAKHHVLLVATVFNGKQNGYVVMDTGAFCSAISREVARTLGGSQIGPEVRFAAGTGAATGQRVSSTVHFAIAGQDLIPEEVLALDLSNVSHHCGVEVMGVLGFPALTHYVLTVDYRQGQVKIEPPQSISAQGRL
jgi:predicted aspartyl protease